MDTELSQFLAKKLSPCCEKESCNLFHFIHFCLCNCLLQGYLVNWDVQRQVWEHMFGKEVMNLEPPDTSIVITEPFFNFGSIQEAMNEVFFEEYQFQAIHRTNGK